MNPYNTIQQTKSSITKANTKKNIYNHPPPKSTQIKKIPILRHNTQLQTTPKRKQLRIQTIINRILNQMNKPQKTTILNKRTTTTSNKHTKNQSKIHKNSPKKYPLKMPKKKHANKKKPTQKKQKNQKIRFKKKTLKQATNHKLNIKPKYTEKHTI